MPPLRMNDRSFGRSSLNSSHQASSRSTYSCSMRSGGNSGFSTTGVQKSAPTSNRSFCTRVSTVDDRLLETADGEREADVRVGLVDVGVGVQPGVVLAS